MLNKSKKSRRHINDNPNHLRFWSFDYEQVPRVLDPFDKVNLAQEKYTVMTAFKRAFVMKHRTPILYSTLGGLAPQFGRASKMHVVVVLIPHMLANV